MVELIYDLPELRAKNIQQQADKPPIYWVDGGSDAMKIEWLFAAGNRFQEVGFQARIMVDNLFSGTHKMNPAELDEQFDLLGAYYNGQSGRDHAYFTGYVLAEQFNDMLDLFEASFRQPAFDQQMLQLSIENGKHEFLSQQQKPEWHARRKFVAELLRPDHELSRLSQLSEYDKLSRELMFDFHSNYIESGPFCIIVTGPDDPQLKASLLKKYGDWGNDESLAKIELNQNDVVGQDKQFKVPGPGKQDAVQVGRICDAQSPTERLQIQLLNLALGGYFGSRLMQNVREHKGWTYGISSRLEQYGTMDLLTIKSNVKKEVGQQAVDEIFFELKRLQSELISDLELQTIKNTLFGQYQRILDGALRQADALSFLKRSRFSMDYFQHNLEVMQRTTSQDLMELAQELCNPESYMTVIIEGSD